MKKFSVLLSAVLATGVLLLTGCDDVNEILSEGWDNAQSVDSIGNNSVDLPNASVSESSLNSSEPESSSDNSDYEASSGSTSEAVSLPTSSSSEASVSEPEPESSSSLSSPAASSSSSKPASSSPAASSSSSKPASSSSAASSSSTKPASSSSVASSSSSKPASSSSSSVPSQKDGCENGVHTLVIDKGVVPTCAKEGLTQGVRCSECGEVFTNQTKLSKVHCYFPTGISGGIVNYSCKGGCGYPFSCTYNNTLSEKTVYNTLIAMKSKYPEGTPFDNSNSYFTNKAFPFVNFTGRGCAGFALELSDTAFGEYPTRYHFDFDKIRVGDIVRISDNQHSVIVLAVNGNEITVAEANYNRSVHWGRTLNLNDPTVGWSYVLTRYPE